MSHLLYAALLAAAAGAQHPAAAFVDRWHEALRGDRREAVLEMMAPDVTVFESGGAEMTRDEYAGHHLGSDMEFARATTTIAKSRHVVELPGGAVVLSHTATSGTFRGQQVSSQGVETMVVDTSGDAWRIRHIHWSSRRSQASDATELTAPALASQLRGAKLAVKERPPVDQPFFSVPAEVLLVGTEELQVFEFANADVAAKAAATVSPDGGTVGTSTMQWMAPPHFHRRGRLVVIHLGTNGDLRSALERILGPQFAGRR